MLILNNFCLDKEPQIGMLFRFDQASITKELKQNPRNGPVFEMVIMSLMVKYDQSDP